MLAWFLILWGGGKVEKWFRCIEQIHEEAYIHLTTSPDLWHIRRKLDRISEEDVKTAIQKVHLLGAGFQLLQSGSSVLVVSVPTELSSDHAAILQEAQRAHGEGEGDGSCCSVTVAGLREGLRWEEGRIRVALDLMMQGGMVWVDEQAGRGGPAYWFPSLWVQARLAASGGGGEDQ